MFKAVERGYCRQSDELGTLAHRLPKIVRLDATVLGPQPRDLHAMASKFFVQWKRAEEVQGVGDYVATGLRNPQGAQHHLLPAGRALDKCHLVHVCIDEARKLAQYVQFLD